MPFPTVNFRPYSLPAIDRMPPEQRGVYGIRNGDKWLYVGRSRDIRASLLEHWANVQLTALGPAEWAFELTNMPAVRQTLLITELRPILNPRTAPQVRAADPAESP